MATAFELALQTGGWNEIATAISTCDELLFETIDGNAERVAELIELAHDTNKRKKTSHLCYRGDKLCRKLNDGLN